MNKILPFFSEQKLYLISLIISSYVFTFYSGFRGVSPLDSFLIFDAGFKILNDFHPFKDYWSITGPFLDYIQALIFYIFNVNWFSYVLHAFILNTILTFATFYFFSTIGLKKNFSFIYSLSISILAYPSVGTPFMDHHANILSLISAMVFILALKKKNNSYWFILPTLLVMSFFSKQIPSVFFGLFFITILFFLLYFQQLKDFNPIFFFSCGSVFIISIIFLLIYLNEIPISNILLQYFYYPISIGESRNNNLILDFKNTFLQFKFIYISIIPLIFVVYILIVKKNKFFFCSSDFATLITLFVSVFIFIYSQLLTKNQILIFFIIPFYIGMSHYFVNKYYKKEYIVFFLFFILIISTVKFHSRFNVDKKFMDLENINLKIGIDGKNLDPNLKSLNWITPLFPKDPLLEIELLKDTKSQIINENNNSIIITDYQILSFLVNSKKFSPNKWFDDLSVPNKKNKYFQEYKTFFLEKLKNENISVIFIVGLNKENYLDDIFFEKSCLSKKNINRLTKKIDISKCNFLKSL